MSTATTSVFLYVGLDNERRDNGGDWPHPITRGTTEMVTWLEGKAVELEDLWSAEFGDLNLTCVFDYAVTAPLGAWLYHNSDCDPAEFAAEARRLVQMQVLSDDLWRRP